MKKLKRPPRLRTAFAAAALSAASLLQLSCIGWGSQKPSVIIEFDQRRFLAQKNEEHVGRVIDFFEATLEKMKGKVIPSPMIVNSGEVPEDVLEFIKPYMGDWLLSRKDMVNGLIDLGESLPHNLQPSEDLVEDCRAILSDLGMEDPEGWKALAMANCAVYMSIEHGPLINRYMGVRDPANDNGHIVNVSLPSLTDDLRAAQTAPYNITVIGDSLAAGTNTNGGANYANSLKAHLIQRGWHIEMNNLSAEGKQTIYGLETARQIVSEPASRKPDLVVLALGGNDFLFQTDPEDVRRNLEDTIILLQQNDIEIVLSGMKAPGWYSKSYQKEFNRIYQDLADQYDLILDPFILDPLVVDEDAPSLKDAFNQRYMSDPIHPNHAGARLIARDLLPEVEKALQRIYKNRLFNMAKSPQQKVPGVSPG